MFRSRSIMGCAIGKEVHETALDPIRAEVEVRLTKIHAALPSEPEDVLLLIEG